jgi:hypothetical protein
MCHAASVVRAPVVVVRRSAMSRGGGRVTQTGMGGDHVVTEASGLALAWVEVQFLLISTPIVCAVKPVR